MTTKDIKPYNDKNQRHGYWVLYHNNDNIASKGNYLNSKRVGNWEIYNIYGKLMHKQYIIL